MAEPQTWPGIAIVLVQGHRGVEGLIDEPRVETPQEEDAMTPEIIGR
jgi:hypothetical protein